MNNQSTKRTTRRVTDHDQLYKELFKNDIPNAVKTFAPKLYPYIDWSTLEPLPLDIFIDNIQPKEADGTKREEPRKKQHKGEKKVVDILAKVKFKGNDIFFLIHIENQSKAEADFAERIFFYLCCLYVLYRIPIYPIVILSYDSPKREEKNRFEMFFPDGCRPLQFEFLAFQLNRKDWKDFQDDPNPVSSALMSKMEISPEDRPKVKLESLRQISSYDLDEARKRFLFGFVDTYLNLKTEEDVEFTKCLERLLPQEKEKAMEIVTSWEIKAMAKGLEKGRDEGRSEATLNLVLRQMKRRLGVVTPETEARLKTLTVEQLENLHDDLLGMESQEDLANWFANLPTPVPSENSDEDSTTDTIS